MIEEDGEASEIVRFLPLMGGQSGVNYAGTVGDINKAWARAALSAKLLFLGTFLLLFFVFFFAVWCMWVGLTTLNAECSYPLSKWLLGMGALLLLQVSWSWAQIGVARLSSSRTVRGTSLRMSFTAPSCFPLLLNTVRFHRVRRGCGADSFQCVFHLPVPTSVLLRSTTCPISWVASDSSTDFHQASVLGVPLVRLIADFSFSSISCTTIRPHGNLEP